MKPTQTKKPATRRAGATKPRAETAARDASMTPAAFARAVDAGLRAVADPDQAASMAAYMKHVQPFLGVPKPGREVLFEDLAPRLVPRDQAEYQATVRALWALPHREGRYMALAFGQRHAAFIALEALPLFEALVREGAWWDVVDELAAHFVGRVYLRHRREVERVMDRWIEDPDLWIRRTAIIAQNGHKAATDQARLFDYCLRRAGETEFFIRKAIGWALREHSKAAPTEVRRFLEANRERLSGLSYREGAKRLVREGKMSAG